MRAGLVGAALLVAAAGSLGNVACAPTLAPVYAPASHAGVGPGGVPYSAEQVEQATVAGAQAKGWTILQRAPGVVIAEASGGGHHARVRIISDASGWRILHEASTPGLKHGHDDRHGEVIHRRYNHWVRLLDESIRNALSGTAGGAAPPAAPPAVPAPAADAGAPG